MILHVTNSSHRSITHDENACMPSPLEHTPVSLAAYLVLLLTHTSA